ncbi:hypothetical protein H4R20_002910 [Coemansia guatemalensis]|uniref:JmjC domain-containing protein n=1 Tax=Coemansia guatemalensis TaxID=2761395 RepID=A0A9W8HUP1_9FUNG|nr:hypothetical protein H4R20_002910 [Coemansia guatemalensis]
MTVPQQSVVPLWTEDAVVAWALDRRMDTVPEAEVLELSRLCAISVERVQQIVDRRLGQQLVRHGENPPHHWTLQDQNNEALTTASDRECSELSQIVAQFPRFMGWVEPTESGSELDNAQKTRVVQMARIAHAAATASDTADERLVQLDALSAVTTARFATGKPLVSMAQLTQVRQTWAEEIARQSRRRRSTRASAAVVDYSPSEAIPVIEEEVVPRKQTPRKRARPEQPLLIPAMDATGEYVRVKRTDNRPEVEQLLRTRDFVPLVFPTASLEPSHAITDLRVVQGDHKVRRQVLPLYEYAVDGFPAPVDPERWLELLQKKYVAWLKEAAACRSVTIANERQAKRCNADETFGSFMCRGCVLRQTNCYCAFRGVRVVTRLTAVLGSGEQVTRFFKLAMVASERPSAKSHVLQVEALKLPVCLGGEDKGEDARRWAEFYRLYSAAGALVPSLDAAAAALAEHPVSWADGAVEYPLHAQLGCSAAPPVIRRVSPGTRQLCDMCATSILAAHYTCSMCALEVCLQCFAEWDDTELIARGRVHDGTQPVPRIAACRRLGRTVDGLRPSATHVRRQFVRASAFEFEDVQRVQKKVQHVVQLGRRLCEAGASWLDCAGAVGDAELSVFSARMLRITQRTRHAHVRAPWELPVAYVEADELSTREFSRLWSRGQVVVVRGLLQKLRAELWQPEWWIRNFGYELVRVLDCARAAAPVAGDEWPLRDFFRLFDNDDRHAELFGTDASAAWDARASQVRGGILKLKDWPPAEDFHRRLPEHFKAFVDAIPFPEYTRRDGVFNLAARLPATAVPPDLGPKMYCAYGSSDSKGGVGTTNLHCDMADAVNIMAYASRGFLRKHSINVPGIWTRDQEESAIENDQTVHSDRVTAAAVWDIFPPHVVEHLRKYIRKRTNAEDGDPIHDQATFLTRPQREELFLQLGGDEGICYRVHQNPGDAVFVPAGSAHQVCNYASAVKVAMDFVSPERVEHCRKLTEEFRNLPLSHPRRSDLLQLNNILWWAFAGEQPVHPSNDPAVASPTKTHKQSKKKRIA